MSEPDKIGLRGTGAEVSVWYKAHAFFISKTVFSQSAVDMTVTQIVSFKKLDGADTQQPDRKRKQNKPKMCWAKSAISKASEHDHKDECKAFHDLHDGVVFSLDNLTHVGLLFILAWDRHYNTLCILVTRLVSNQRVQSLCAPPGHLNLFDF